MKDKIKYYTVLFVMNMLKVFWLFPIKNNRMYFISFSGKQYSDSPKYISEFFINNYKQYEIIWAFKDPKTFEDLTQIVKDKVNSIQYFYHMMTAKIIVTNNMLNSYIPIRKDQVVLNTWHGGGALKKVGLACDKITDYEKYHLKIQCEKYTAFSCDSKATKELLYRRSFGFTGELLEYGLPRNQILFTSNDKDRIRILQSIGVDPNSIVVLYAPTFRGQAQNAKFQISELSPDFDTVVSVVNKKFKKPVSVLFRGHHEFSKNINLSNVINVTEYRDMQELIVAADCLITDYSSCMWDMAVAQKAVFLYGPDIDLYLKTPGFFTDIKELPFRMSKNMSELITEIEHYDKNKYLHDLNNYFEKMGSYENRYSLNKTCEWIIKQF